MPASSAEARAKWRKRKRDQAARKAKLKEADYDDTFEENDDDHDLDLDPRKNQETEDDPLTRNAYRTTRISREKESEKLMDGGLRISEFPIAIKRVVDRPHLSVFDIVEAERATRNGESRAQGQVGVAGLENISFGQLQALSAVPRDSPVFLGAFTEETTSGSAVGSYVMKPPRITAGRGVTKRFGSANRVHIVPEHSDWFSPNSVHRLERQVVPHFFSGKSADHTPEKYMESRNFIVAKYMKNPENHLSVDDCQGLVHGVDFDDLTRIIRFLDHWGIINYCAAPLKHESLIYGTYLSEDSNGELHVPSAALKSIDSLIQFDKPKCRLKATDVNPELGCQHHEDSEFENIIREQLSEHQCSYCSQPIPAVYYQSQKEVDVILCSGCFHEGKFVAGHSTLDYMKVNSMMEYGDMDGYSWSDQETLLLLEGMQLHNENWNKIAEHIGSKSKDQCILHFVRLSVEGAPLENIDIKCTSGSLNSWSHDNYEKSEPNSNGLSLHGVDSESIFPFSSSGNPVMNLVAFLVSALGPRVAAAGALASLESLSKDGIKEGSADSSKREVVPLSAERVKAAAKDGLAAAALKAKLFADHEEREIQRLSANIINHQLKRLELKLKQFADVETLLMMECEQMERTRQRTVVEKSLVMSAQSGSSGMSWQMGSPSSIGNANVNNHQQVVLGSQQPYVSGYGNNQQVHPHMSLMQQQGMYGLGPRFPPSTINQSSSAPNGNFNQSSSSPSSLGHPMLRPVSGTKSGLG